MSPVVLAVLQLLLLLCYDDRLAHRWLELKFILAVRICWRQVAILI